MKKLNYIDLFAGCGGLSLGFHLAGLQGLFAIEKSADAFLTLQDNLIEKRNHFKWPKNIPQKNYDINYFLKNHSDYLSKLRGKIDLIAGGPPCQGFSTAGKRMEQDSRNSLVKSYLKFVELVSPKIILFENVQGFTQEFKTHKKGENGINYSKYVIKRLEDLGYKVDFRLVDFSDYGVPQKRKRFILVGTKRKDNNFFENLEAAAKVVIKQHSLKRVTSNKDALSDLVKENGFLEDSVDSRFEFGKYSKVQSSYQKLMRRDAGKTISPDSHRFSNHNSETLTRFKKIMKLSQKGQVNYKKLEGLGTKKLYVNVLHADEPSPTLTTLPDDILHYNEPRILTVREYARLQSFPDWFEFKGKYTTGGKNRRFEVPRYSQIGNAIPPLFAEICGHAILKTLRG